MNEKPSLQEIADMPFPASERALQQYYGVEPWRERAEGKTGIWTVKVDWSYSERFHESGEFEVEADDEDEAIRLAEKACTEENGFESDFDLDEAEVVERPE